MRRSVEIKAKLAGQRLTGQPHGLPSSALSLEKAKEMAKAAKAISDLKCMVALFGAQAQYPITFHVCLTCQISILSLIKPSCVVDTFLLASACAILVKWDIFIAIYGQPRALTQISDTRYLQVPCSSGMKTTWKLESSKLAAMTLPFEVT